MTIDESLEAFRPVLARATELGWWTRAYVSTAFGCPFTGRVRSCPGGRGRPARLVDLGADEICLGDTIGVGVPSQVHELTGRLLDAGLSLDRLAYHFHDTRGTALANVVAGLEDGVACFDASTGGTGGCPYAPGAAGNLATEDLVYLLDGMGIEHGVDLGGRARRGPLHRRGARQAAGQQGRPGGRLGPRDGDGPPPAESMAWAVGTRRVETGLAPGGSSHEATPAVGFGRSRGCQRRIWSRRARVEGRTARWTGGVRAAEPGGRFASVPGVVWLRVQIVVDKAREMPPPRQSAAMRVRSTGGPAGVVRRRWWGLVDLHGRRTAGRPPAGRHRRAPGGVADDRARSHR